MSASPTAWRGSARPHPCDAPAPRGPLKLPANDNRRRASASWRLLHFALSLMVVGGFGITVILWAELLARR